MEKIKILFEDNHIIVAYKEPNVLSQADITGDCDMLSLLKDHIKHKHHKEGNIFLGLVHRLDRMTSGVMVFARTSKAAARLSKEMKEGMFQKNYLAVLNGNLTGEGCLEHRLEKNEQENKSYVSKDGKLAKLKYQAIETGNNQRTLVKIMLETGRHHQIRVQFAAIHHSVYGDVKYDGNNKKGILHLCAYELRFKHPVKNEIMTFVITPAYGSFMEFKYILERIDKND